MNPANPMSDATPTPTKNITAAEYMLGGLAVELEHLAGMAKIIYEAQIRVLSKLEDRDEVDLRMEFDESYREYRHVARMAMREGPNGHWPVWDVLPSEAARPGASRRGEGTGSRE